MKNKINTLRIQSGKLKGRVLLLPSKNSTRPTKSIVKACVFNSIREIIYDSIFIEAFGGSASMAIEAVSNGAKKAYAVELDKDAYICASKNAQDLNIDVIKGDTFIELPLIINKEKKQNIILYVDPPFDIRDGFSGIYEKVMKFFEFDVDIIIFEHASTIKIESIKFNNYKIKKFGNTTLSFFKKA